MSKVRFNFADIKRVTIKNKKEFEALVEKLFKEENKTLKKINYIFCSDDYLLNINKSFLKHDIYTDIVTFDLSEGEEIIGEAYISIDRVRENSVINHVSFIKELMRVVFHGALHLCGYKDKKKGEIIEMRQKEEYYLLWLS